MSPTPLAEPRWSEYFNSWPKLLEKLALNDGLEFFLEWKNQYEDWCDLYGTKRQFCGGEARYHAFFLLDRQLSNILRERMGPNFVDMDFQTFVEELHEIFDDNEETVVISNPISCLPKSILKTQTPPLKTNLKAEKPLKSILKKPMVLASVVEAHTVKIE